MQNTTPAQARGATPSTTVGSLDKVQPRRNFLLAASATALGSMAACSTAGPQGAARQKGTTFVLVHGGWHGGWCWDRVSPMLRTAGHDVHTPSLTGLGDRAHLSSPENSLQLHIQDIVSLIESHELDNVVLVGHSYGGMVITGAADRLPARIKRLVYLNAFVPEKGKSLMDYLPPAVRDPITREGAATGMVSPLPVAILGVTQPEDVQWVTRRMVKQSYRSYAEPITLSNAARDRIPCSFVNFSTTTTGAFDPFIAKVRNDPKWQLFNLHAGIDAMITEPRGLADILLKNA